MAWLVKDAQVLASLEIADSHRSRRRGLLGRSDYDGVLLLRPARSVHTLGMRFPIDVAHCRTVEHSDGEEEELEVLHLTTMGRHRLGRISLHGNCVLEAEAGSFERWGVMAGDRLAIRS